jgi:hypothetical protein
VFLRGGREDRVGQCILGQCAMVKYNVSKRSVRFFERIKYVAILLCPGRCLEGVGVYIIDR